MVTVFIFHYKCNLWRWNVASTAEVRMTALMVYVECRTFSCTKVSWSLVAWYSALWTASFMNVRTLFGKLSRWNTLTCLQHKPGMHRSTGIRSLCRPSFVRWRLIFRRSSGSKLRYVAILASILRWLGEFCKIVHVCHKPILLKKTLRRGKV